MPFLLVLWILTNISLTYAADNNLSPPELDHKITSLINDLKDDHIRYNATTAIRELENIGKPAIPYLEEALHSDDKQQRQCAAAILRRFDGYQPSLQMLWVIIEGLKNDHLPVDRGYTRHREWGSNTPVYNASFGLHYLLERVEQIPEANALLIQAVREGDFQQRFLCAYILGMTATAKPDQKEEVAEVLIEHLKDNEILMDACMSCAALYRLGVDILFQLAEHLENSQDTQQQQALQLIIDDLNHPPESQEDLRQRREQCRLSWKVWDPAFEGFRPYCVSRTFNNQE